MGETGTEAAEKLRLRKIEVKNFSISFPAFAVSLSVTISNSSNVDLCQIPIF